MEVSFLGGYGGAATHYQSVGKTKRVQVTGPLLSTASSSRQGKKRKNLAGELCPLARFQRDSQTRCFFEIA
jgi:hypothetical protein